MLTAWLLQYWLCDDPSGECRPGPRAIEMADEGACLRAGRDVRHTIAAAAAVHCHHIGLIEPARATTTQAAGQKPACPGDQVVWVNTRTHIYHVQGSRWFGATRAGKYACRRDADREGDHVTRGE